MFIERLSALKQSQLLEVLSIGHKVLVARSFLVVGVEESAACDCGLLVYSYQII